MLKDFINKRLDKWKRLEYYIDIVSRNRLSSLKRDEVREFGRLYRRTAADLAIAHQEVRDPRLVNYLNNLVGRAHGAVYRTEQSRLRDVIDFYRYELPAIFRQTFKYTLLAFVIFLISGLFAFYFTYRDDSFADLIVPGIRTEVIKGRNWTEVINQANPVAAAGIQSNNILVTVYAFVGGVTLGLLTIRTLIFNGMMLGAVMSLCIKYKFYPILIFVAGHGVLELSAIFIGGGAGFLLTGALLMPGNLSCKDALVRNGGYAIKLILACIPMLIIAGIIEGFISPAHIPAGFKLAVSVITGILMVAYFLKPDKRAIKPK